jgi:hypothetical protein
LPSYGSSLAAFASCKAEGTRARSGFDKVHRGREAYDHSSETPPNRWNTSVEPGRSAASAADDSKVGAACRGQGARRPQGTIKYAVESDLLFPLGG